MHTNSINKPTYREEQPQPEEMSVIGKPSQIEVQICRVVKVLFPIQSLLLFLRVHRTEHNPIQFYRCWNKYAHKTSVFKGAHRIRETRWSQVILSRNDRKQPISLHLTSPKHPNNWTERSRQRCGLLRTLILPPALHVRFHKLRRLESKNRGDISHNFLILIFLSSQQQGCVE